MKQEKILFWGFIFFIILSLNGCKSKADDKSFDLPGVSIPVNQLNTKTKLYAPPESNTFIQVDEVAVVLENLTESPVVLPSDYGVKIFLLSKEENKWTPIDNGMGYPEGQIVLLPKGQQPFGGLLIVVYPHIEFLDKPYTVRIVVVGTIEDERKKNENVGAFTDITLSPQK